MKILVADPAKNITVFVLDPVENPEKRASIARAILAEKSLGAEQVGFVFPPDTSASASGNGLWHLEMAGGEFCGNASRSLGLLAAAESGLSGKHTLTIETSGISGSVPVHIDTEAQTAEIAIPGPAAQTAICLEGRHYPVYEFEGITHIIAEGMQMDERIARLAIRTYNEGRLAAGKQPCSALGVMFYDAQKCFMRPVVWTRDLDTLVCESSCGSGSAALGVWAVRNTEDAELTLNPEQPGGTITVSVAKQAGIIKRLSISGKVSLGKPFHYRIFLLAV